MKLSSANSEETAESRGQQGSPQTISMPREQVTGDPVPGYTTADFWRDFEEKHNASATEFGRFEHLARQLVRVSKDEIDEKRRTVG